MSEEPAEAETGAEASAEGVGEPLLLLLLAAVVVEAAAFKSEAAVAVAGGTGAGTEKGAVKSTGGGRGQRGQ